MKRLLFILGFVLTITLQIQAKDILTVFRVTGEVKCCPIRSEQWGLLARHDTVKLSDRIIIPEDGVLRLHSSESGIIHTCKKSGTFTVKQIIEYSESQNRTLAGAVAREVANEMSSKASSGDRKISRIHGATSRGDELYDNSVEKAMASFVLKGKTRLKVSLVPEGECYRLQVNNPGKNRRISIVYISKGKAVFCVPPEGIIMTKGETVLPAPEVFPSPDGRYCAFEVKQDYDSDEFLRLLNND